MITELLFVTLGVLLVMVLFLWKKIRDHKEALRVLEVEVDTLYELIEKYEFVEKSKKKG